MTRTSKQQIESRTLPSLTLRAAVEPSTFNAGARTVEVTWTTGSRGLRAGWPDDYYEELSLDPSAVKLDRLNRGAPVLNAHSRWGLRDVIGVVERAWIANGEGRALLRFSEREDVAPIVRDIESGILRNISVGYAVQKYERIVAPNKGEPDTLRAIEWEPFEISFVPVGFDAGAQTRGAESERAVVQIVTTVWTDPAEGGAEEAGTENESTTKDETDEQAAQRSMPSPSTSAAQELTMTQSANNGADTMQRILALGDQYRAYVPGIDKLVGEALRAGKSEADFNEMVMKDITSRHTDMRSADIGMSDKEAQRYSITRAVVAQLTGDWSAAGLERAASEAVAKKFGKSADGFYVPMDAFRDFTAGAATEAGNLIATDLRADLFTDVLRKQLCLAKLGVTFLPGLTANIALPRKTAAGTLGFVAEVGAASETSPVTGQISMTPKRISAYVEYSKQALIQSALALEPLLRQDLLDGLAVEIDEKGLNGTAASNQPRGLRNTSGVGAVLGGTNGAALNWGHIVGLETAVANANAQNTDRAGYCVNTKVVGMAKTTQKASNLPFIWDDGDRPLNGHRAAISNLMPSNLTKGTSSGICSSLGFSSDWSMMVVGLFGAVDVTVDPYTLATTGMVRITVNHFIDVGVRQPAAFALMDDALTS